jgi:hypothetical protein
MPKRELEEMKKERKNSGEETDFVWMKRRNKGEEELGRLYKWKERKKSHGKIGNKGTKGMKKEIILSSSLMGHVLVLI